MYKDHTYEVIKSRMMDNMNLKVDKREGSVIVDFEPVPHTLRIIIRPSDKFCSALRTQFRFAGGSISRADTLGVIAFRADAP